MTKLAFLEGSEFDCSTQYGMAVRIVDTDTGEMVGKAIRGMHFSSQVKKHIGLGPIKDGQIDTLIEDMPYTLAPQILADSLRSLATWIEGHK